MGSSTRVLVAMSGGVDSSLAAAMLKQQGHDVVGVTLHLWDAEGEDKVGRCCAPEDRDDARRTCELLGVPHYVIDERQAFRSQVVDPFIAQNLAGQTPIPCVACNQHVKLTRLWQLAQSFGATALATGHYARIVPTADGSVDLLRGVDPGKDQSYFLYGVPQAVLRNLLLPLGELHKHDARLLAKEFGLPNWSKPDSQELCFVPDGDVRGFLRRHAPAAGAPGDIIDETGTVLGQHQGVEGFTVGQRRGIGIPGPTPRYVLRVIHDSRQVVVGSAKALARAALEAQSVVWTSSRPERGFTGQVRIRSHHTAAEAWVTPTEAGFSAEFVTPQIAVAPGQAAVVYTGERVIGGGFIV